MWILFVPALPFELKGQLVRGIFWAGLGEQLCGMICDFALINTWWYLWSKAEKNSAVKVKLLASGPLCAFMATKRNSFVADLKPDCLPPSSAIVLYYQCIRLSTYNQSVYFVLNKPAYEKKLDEVCC